jgi:hypothetical protein
VLSGSPALFETWLEVVSIRQKDCQQMKRRERGSGVQPSTPVPVGSAAGKSQFGQAVQSRSGLKPIQKRERRMPVSLYNE